LPASFEVQRLRLYLESGHSVLQCRQSIVPLFVESVEGAEMHQYGHDRRDGIRFRILRGEFVNLRALRRLLDPNMRLPPRAPSISNIVLVQRWDFERDGASTPVVATSFVTYLGGGFRASICFARRRAAASGPP
jgi:hypothetical protein